MEGPAVECAPQVVAGELPQAFVGPALELRDEFGQAGADVRDAVEELGYNTLPPLPELPELSLAHGRGDGLGDRGRERGVLRVVQAPAPVREPPVKALLVPPQPVLHGELLGGLQVQRLPQAVEVLRRLPVTEVEVPVVERLLRPVPDRVQVLALSLPDVVREPRLEELLPGEDVPVLREQPGLHVPRGVGEPVAGPRVVRRVDELPTVLSRLGLGGGGEVVVDVGIAQAVDLAAENVEVAADPGGGAPRPQRHLAFALLGQELGELPLRDVAALGDVVQRVEEPPVVGLQPDLRPLVELPAGREVAEPPGDLGLFVPVPGRHLRRPFQARRAAGGGLARAFRHRLVLRDVAAVLVAGALRILRGRRGLPGGRRGLGRLVRALLPLPLEHRAVVLPAELLDQPGPYILRRGGSAGHLPDELVPQRGRLGAVVEGRVDGGDPWPREGDDLPAERVARVGDRPRRLQPPDELGLQRAEALRFRAGPLRHEPLTRLGELLERREVDVVLRVVGRPPVELDVRVVALLDLRAQVGQALDGPGLGGLRRRRARRRRLLADLRRRLQEQHLEVLDGRVRLVRDVLGVRPPVRRSFRDGGHGLRASRRRRLGRRLGHEPGASLVLLERGTGQLQLPEVQSPLGVPAPVPVHLFLGVDLLAEGREALARLGQNRGARLLGRGRLHLGAKACP
ncbi:hypothetical protein GCM10023196_017090 [Actinoallomurus vinaceus]|uniref:Uncharacterized protein n=1 Tax=Actinoallomurus vinaceus TaxID=1080074 RepID=A0ABP8U894_9ACTN